MKTVKFEYFLPCSWKIETLFLKLEDKSYRLCSFKPFFSDRLSQTYLYKRYRIVHFVLKGCLLKFPWSDVFKPMDIVFILMNREYSDEMLHYAAFHLGHHHLLKYLFTSIQSEKRLNTGASLINWAATWEFQQCGMCDQQRLRPACAYAQSDKSLC